MSKHGSLRIAVAQFSPGVSLHDNLASIRSFVGEAEAAGAGLVLFPEYSNFWATPTDGRFAHNAEGLDGPFVETVRELAESHRLHVVAGFAESRSADDTARPRVYNTVVAINPTGDVVATYQKQHLYDAFGSRESDWVEPGPLDPPQIFEAHGLRCALQTCYDIRFPEVSRRAVDAGAQVLLVPAQWVPGEHKLEQWTTLLRARAIENTVYVAAADQAGPGGIGFSMVIDPRGVVMESCDESPGVVSALASLEGLARVRDENPALQLRRYRVVPA